MSEEKKSLFKRAAEARAAKGLTLESPEADENGEPIIELNLLTKKQLQEIVPTTQRPSITDKLVESINTISQDPIQAENIRENIIKYSKVLYEGQFRINDYINAVKYSSFKLMGYSNEESYARTFPDRYAILRARGASKKDISAYVSMYHKNAVVTKILEKAYIPVWLLNSDYFQQALEVNVTIMKDETVSPKVRVEAANSVMTQLQRPKEATLNVNVNDNSDTSMKEMKDLLVQLAATQRNKIIEGELTPQEVAEMKIINSPEEE